MEMVLVRTHFRPYTFARLTLRIGPEVVNEAVRVLQVVSDASSEFKLNLIPYPFGGGAIDSVGHPLPDSTLKACQEADAILMGELLARFTE